MLSLCNLTKLREQKASSCSCRRTKWQFFQPDNRKRANDKGTDQEDDSSQAAPDTDAEDEPVESGEDDDESETQGAQTQQLKKRKRTWRKEEDSAVLWNIVKYVLHQPCWSPCPGSDKICHTRRASNVSHHVGCHGIA